MRVISTCKAITIIACIAITITIIHYFHEKKGILYGHIYSHFIGNFGGQKTSKKRAENQAEKRAENQAILNDERRRNQMVAKASIYFF
jgi:hypothetical protein